MARAPVVEVVPSAEAAGQLVASRVVDELATRPDSMRLVVGWPAGRTPASSVAALAAHAEAGHLDLSRLTIVMMDEYVVEDGGRYRGIDPTLPHSCRGYAERDLRQRLNAGVPDDRALPAAQVYAPDAGDPDAYEQLIDDLGGIDVFLLAAGGRDGHVAFNPPGSSVESRTRIVTLAQSTRRDNLDTFPSLGTIEAVPRFGVTVGLGTIARASRAVVLVLLGREKHDCFERTTGAGGFDDSWPATIVWACADATIVADADAAGRDPEVFTSARRR